MKTMKRMLRPALALIFLSALIALCGCRKKTEREQYEKATSTLKYRTYKALSESVFPPAFKTYNAEVPDSLKVREEAGRLLLGYFWICSGKTTFGFAEGNIVSEQTREPQFTLLAKMMIAIGMYENGWKGLAEEETEGAVTALYKSPEGKFIKLELTIIELLVGTYCVYDRDFDRARFHFADFANLTGIEWPYTLADGMGDVESGNIQSGLKKVRAMTTDESVPTEVREVLKTAIDEVESETGSVDSMLFWPKVISGILYDELKEITQPGIQPFMKMLDDIKMKF